MKTISINIEVPDDFQDIDLPKVIAAAECQASEDYLVEIWSIEDVQDCSRDELTDEQAREVLNQVKRYHDANIGINWGVIEYHASEVFSESEV